MRVTKYNKRIIIQNGTKVENDIGGWSIENWKELYTSWAFLKTLSGIPRFEYGKYGITEAYEVEMKRRTTDPDSDCRIIYDKRIFQIALLNHDSDKTYMLISR